MELGFSKIIAEGNGNTLIYIALLSGALANTIPTPFDAIYFKRVNKLERDFDSRKISAENLELHIAIEYYIWTSLWYLSLFFLIYAYGQNYKTNTKILVSLIAVGFVIATINKNIEKDKKFQLEQDK